jgi:hypothetical protein
LFIMTKAEATGYEMECATAEHIEAWTKQSSEQLFYVASLAMEACIARPDSIRPCVLHETAEWMERLIPERTIRFQPLMQKRLDDRYAAFVEAVRPYLGDAQQSRSASQAARKELHSSI